MRALIVRELIVAARRPGVPLAMCVVAAVLTSFVLVWSPGVSALAPMNLYEQARLLHWIALAGALPWTAVRSAPSERGDAFVRLAALTALPPATIVVGKTIATAGVLSLTVLTGLPALVLAQQAAAVPFLVVLRDLLPLLGVTTVVATIATASILLLPDSLGAWTTSAAAVFALLTVAARWAPGAPAIGLASALLGVAGAAGIGVWSNGALRYLREGDAE